MTAPVFISHSSKDRKVARRICTALEDQGLTCWVADRDVSPGENFQEAIVRAIRAAKVMVLVFTDNANSSPEIKKELAIASRLSLTVIPARVENVAPSEAFEYELATRQWIDLFENWQEEIERLTLSIGKTLAIDTRVGVGLVTPQHPPQAPNTEPHMPKGAPPNRPPPSANVLAPIPKVERPPLSEPALKEEPARDHRIERWSLTTLIVIAVTAAILGALLGDHSVSSTWRDWTSAILTAVSVLTLIVMTLGLALFYGDDGSVAEILERVLVTVGVIAFVWIVFGYSLTFTGEGDFIGGFSRAFLTGLTGSRASTFTVGVTISELSFVIFQGCLAAIALALVIGMLGKRMKLAAIALFVPLWVMLIYFPITHMVWYWTGPDAISDAVKALNAAGAGAAKTAAQARLDEVTADAGWLYKKGMIDYAGGTIMAINAGVAGLVGFFQIDGATVSAPRNSSRPMSGKSVLGLLLMWLAWFGLNAASYLDFGDPATKVAMASCFSATGAAAIAGVAVEWLVRGRISLRGVLYSALAGIVAVTPVSAFSGTGGAIVLGLCAGALAIGSLNASRSLGFGSLPDLPLIYFSGGILGTLLTGILLNPALGGMGVIDYTTGKIADYDFAAQMISQIWGVCTTLLWAGIGSAILYKVVDMFVGLRPVARVPLGSSPS